MIILNYFNNKREKLNTKIALSTFQTKTSINVPRETSHIPLNYFLGNNLNKINGINPYNIKNNTNLRDNKNNVSRGTLFLI